MTSLNKTHVLFLSALLIGSCTACSTSNEVAVTTEVVTVTQEVQPEATTEVEQMTEETSPATPTCGEADPAVAAASAIAQFPSTLSWDWDPQAAAQYYAEAYDPCAALSAIVIPVTAPARMSPYPVAFFHYGQFVGTDKQEAANALGASVITRIDDSTLELTKSFFQEGDASQADASGRSISIFRWDEASQSLVQDQ